MSFGDGVSSVMPRRNAQFEVADDAEKSVPRLLIAGEAKREAEGPPEHRRPAHRDEALHHDREHVLPPDEPAVEERQPRRHQHDEAGAQQHEAGVPGIEM